MAKFFRHLLLATYKTTTHKYVSDVEMCKIYEVEHSRITNSRNQLIQEGHSFVFMTELTQTNSIRMVYKYVGETNLGLVCVDDKKDAMDGDTLLRLRYRMQSTTMCNLLEVLAPLNTKGYWTDVQLSEILGLEVKTVKASVANLVKHYNLIIHHRENVNNRQHRITGIKLPSAIAASTAPKDHSILNKVFQ
ncbi:hypothetical protein NVP2044O_49 [Vibrio phage 2.044.O._10N.261.51.B8]|nr:hypothetical protein NVP2044O_49 [Vibrio phage 2.044.O._10N.261.51.B8]